MAEGANEGVEASPNASLTTANCNAQKPKRPQKGGEKETEGARRGLPSQGKQEQNHLKGHLKGRPLPVDEYI